MSAVDEFQRLAKLLGKWVLIALALLVALTLIITASYIGHAWWTHDRHVALVVATARIDAAKCSASEPLRIELFNGSKETIEHSYVALSAKRPGRSTDIGSVYDESDYVIPPGKTLWACAVPNVSVAVPGEDLRQLEWGIRSISVRFAD